jgi:phage-related protein (TIGR01555 family)
MRRTLKTKVSATKATRADGWGNLLTGLGMTLRDKRLSTQYNVDLLTREEEEAIYRGSDLAARIVDIPVDESLREGFRINVQPLKKEVAPGPAIPAPTDNPLAPPKVKTDAQNAYLPGDFQPGVYDPSNPVNPPGNPALELARATLAAKPSPGVIQEQDSYAKAASEGAAAKLKALQFYEILKKVLQYKRAYGGGGILIGADDGTKDMSKPLNVNNIKTLNWLTPLTSRELYPVSYYADPFQPKFGQPEIYRIQPEAWMVGPGQSFNSMLANVHESRIIKFVGITVSKRQVLERLGWGDSIFVRCNRVLSDFDMTWASAAVLISDFSQAVYKMTGLAEIVTNNNKQALQNRITAMDMARSVLRSVVIGENEEFERKSTPMTGLPDMLDKFMLRLAAAGGLPVSLLMGQAPAGLNATGASDIRFFYDRLAGEQENELKPSIEYLLKLIFLTKDGPTKGKEPDNWSITFKSLWQLTELEEAQKRKVQAETDHIYMADSVVTPEEITQSRFGGDEYSTHTSINYEQRKQAAAKAEQDKQSALQTLQNNPPPVLPKPNGKTLVTPNA